MCVESIEIASGTNQREAYSIASSALKDVVKGKRPSTFDADPTERSYESVLVVNDIQDQLDLMSMLLRKSGYSVITAADGREGYEVALEMRPDIIISDVSMPRMDGIEMCQLLRKHTELQATPILLVSAIRKDSESAVQGLQAGADDYQEVPFDPMRLVAKVARLIERKRHEESLRASEERARMMAETALQAARCLEESEQRYKSLFNYNPDAIFSLDLEGCFTSTNQACHALTGLEAEELVGRHILSLFMPEDQERIAEYVQKTLAGETQASDITIRRKDGRFVDLSFKTMPVVVHDEVTGLYGVARDVTEHKRAEEALRESEHRFRAYIENASDNITIVAADGTAIYQSPSVERLTGYKPEELVGGIPFARVYPDDLERVMLAFERGRQSQSVMESVEYRYLHRDGSVRTFESIGRGHVNEKGELVGIINTRDITERRKMEAALRQSEERYRGLFENANDIIYTQDLAGNFISVNKMAETLTGYSLDEIVKMNFLQLFPAADIEKMRGMVESKLSGETDKTNYEITFLTKDGRALELEVHTTLIYENGEPVGIQGIARDITERRRSEEENKKLLHDMGKRVKELTALRRTARILLDEEKSVPQLLSEIVSLLPPAWQYPEVTAARITFGEMEFKTENFSSTQWSQTTECICAGLKGTIEVVYLEERPGEAIGPFLLEEKNLIDSLAEMISSALNRRYVQEALSESEERFRQLTDNMHELLWMHTLDYSEILYLSPAFEKIWGRPRKSLYDNPGLFLDAVHPEDRDTLAETIRQNRLHEFEVEYRIVRPDGTVRWIWDRSFPIKDREGRIYRIAGIAEDITERKSAEERLKKSEAQLAEAQRVAHIGSFEWDAVTKNSTWSDEFYRILGLDPQFKEVSDELLANYFFPTEFELLKQLFRKALRDENFVCEHRLKRVDGALRVLQIRGQRVLDDEGNTTKVIGTVQDITELKEAEAALRKSEEQFLQSQKMEAIGQLAGGVAHDFNNLLTTIMGYSDLALRNLRESDPLRRNLEEIKKSGNRAASLTRQLLAFSRKQVLQPQVLVLNSIIADMAKMLPRLIGENINLRTVLAPSLGSVKADPGQIEQVILNLAVNARDAMLEGGKLTIETHNVYLDASYASVYEEVTPGPYVVLAVSDTGSGMDEETQARIFEPFFTTKVAGKGTGLGLSTVYGIVRQSGGHIWVYSEIGRGTTFKIYLPRVDEEAEEYRHKVEGMEVPRGTETILIVEDEEMLRELTREVLEFNGYEVLVADSGRAALQICEQYTSPIHLLMTDVVMPEMSGRVLSERALQIRPEMSVLYMSGYTDDAIVHHGVLDEGTNFIQKPFTLDSLAQKVREVLDQATE